jgi:hypothetical protein
VKHFRRMTLRTFGVLGLLVILFKILFLEYKFIF